MTESRKVAGVIVTHGHLAGELLAAAEMIVGPISHIAAVSIGWHDDVDAARDEVQRAITRVSQGAALELPILRWDERWSTASAERAMIDQDMSRAKRAARIDSHAAAVILQAAIDRLAGGVL